MTTNPQDPVEAFMKSIGFLETYDDGNSRWVLKKGPVWPRVQCNQVTAAFFYREAKRMELKARINEWESIDGDDAHYWDYREVGKTVRKVYLSPIERNDELEAQLQLMEGE